MSRVRLAAALAAVGVTGALAAPAWATSSAVRAAARTVTVIGSGTATAVPDATGWTFGVTARGETARAAQSTAAAAAAKLIAAVEAAGVADRDVQTQGIALGPRRSNDGTRIVGWEASNTVSVTVRDVSRSGAVVDAAVGAGATDVSGPAFTVAGQAALERDALTRAFAAARAKAQALARQAGARLGRPTSITEGASQPIVFASAERSGGAAASTPVEPGRSTIQATVTVTFALT